MKNLKLALLILTIPLLFTACKYEDGPIVSLRSKQNRVAHRIGKYWKSDVYVLKMGQEGYALSKIYEEGFFDLGDWEFDDTKENIIFTSEDFPDYTLHILQLQHKKMKLEGIFPFDEEFTVHEFEMDKSIDDLD